MKTDIAHPDRKAIQSLFNAISAQYDFLNSFLSFGLHHYWRKMLVEHSSPLSAEGRIRRSCGGVGEDKGGGEGMLKGRVLDLGVGTGKSLEAFLKERHFKQAVGCDFSTEMLEQARARLGRLVQLVACDFHDLPFSENAFDLVTGSFILRSVQDMASFLSEAKRVLRPNGRAVFLELTRPQNRLLWRFFYQPYLKFYVPLVGRFFSRHDHAYEFLSQSVQAFSEPKDLRREFEAAGFTEVSIASLSFGTAAIVEGKNSS
ncbi:MAG: ubiquinone/menaquinone biosynthesis methyltransferase [Candidatus Omnitrophica bacterium]|nr:ubiquinone/menaquinone biosynthesis methyltransferase [Candidatus Omnitrophota bacterium]